MRSHSSSFTGMTDQPHYENAREVADEVMKRFQEKWKLHRFRARERLLETLIACHREAGGKEERPTIAIVDYEDVPTRTEHHLFREFFESRGRAKRTRKKALLLAL